MENNDKTGKVLTVTLWCFVGAIALLGVVSLFVDSDSSELNHTPPPASTTSW